MNQALGLSEAAFGLGAGLFFIGYFLFEVPSNLFLERVGARVWIARIMITWGIVSAAFAFIPWISAKTGVPTDRRVLLPAPAARGLRGRFLPGHHLLSDAVVSRRSTAPASSACSCWRSRFRRSSGSPISGLLLGVTGWGLDGWQWLFILEGVAVDPGRHRRADLSDRFPAPGQLAATGRDRLARARAGHREGQQGKGRTPLAGTGADRSAHSACALWCISASTPPATAWRSSCRPSSRVLASATPRPDCSRRCPSCSAPSAWCCSAVIPTAPWNEKATSPWRC